MSVYYTAYLAMNRGQTRTITNIRYINLQQECGAVNLLENFPPPRHHGVCKVCDMTLSCAGDHLPGLHP